MGRALFVWSENIVLHQGVLDAVNPCVSIQTVKVDFILSLKFKCMSMRMSGVGSAIYPWFLGMGIDLDIIGN